MEESRKQRPAVSCPAMPHAVEPNAVHLFVFFAKNEENDQFCSNTSASRAASRWGTGATLLSSSGLTYNWFHHESPYRSAMHASSEDWEIKAAECTGYTNKRTAKRGEKSGMGPGAMERESCRFW